MMTKQRWLVVPASLAILLAACSSGGGATTAPESIKMGFVTIVVNPFIQQVIDGAKAAAADLDVDLQVTGPEGGDADAQLKAAQTLVAAGAKGIVIQPAGDSIAKGLNDIVDSGIPIVQVNLLAPSVKAPFVGERATESGRILGKQVLEKIGGATATGKVIIGNCFPGFPVLEERGQGVKESLQAASGLTVLGPFDVKVAANENYAAWEALLAANPDVKAFIGLCAPDIASLGKLQAANMTTPFVSGGYDLTTENLAQIKAGNAYVSLGQSPFTQGYTSLKILVDKVRGTATVDLKAGGFFESGTEIVTAESVTEPFDQAALTFAQLEELAASPEKTRAYYQPLIDGRIKDWVSHLEPIANESK